MSRESVYDAFKHILENKNSELTDWKAIAMGLDTDDLEILMSLIIRLKAIKALNTG